MSYISAVQSGDEVLVWERHSPTDRILKRYPGIFEFYAKSKKGEYLSIYDEPLVKYEFDSFSDFREARKYLIDDKHIKLYESDVNIPFKVLSKYYNGIPSPKINVTFYDIEVNYSASLGFASPMNPYAEINAISLHHHWKNKSIVLAVPPPNWDKSQFDESLRELSEVKFFKTEKELLKAFLDEIENTDVMSGWNCICENEHVATSNKLIPIKNLTTFDKLYQHDEVLIHKNTGVQPVYRLTTELGNTIDTSSNHVFPFFIKQPTSYKSLRTLSADITNLSVADAINEINLGSELYVSLPKHDNTNLDLTYKHLIDNASTHLESNNIIRIITNSTIKKAIKQILTTEQKREIFRHSEYQTNREWEYNKLIKYLPDDIINELNNDDVYSFSFTDEVKIFDVHVNEIIPTSLLQLLGFVYTDGHFSNYDNCYSICNTNSGIQIGYENTLYENHIRKNNTAWYVGADRCSYRRFTKFSPFTLLCTMIYNGSNKSIDVELLSLLSKKQFAAVFSGMIDGDGSVLKKSINLCNYNNDLLNIQRLLWWNSCVSYVAKSNNLITLPFNFFNQHFIQMMQLFHTAKKTAVHQLKLIKTKNSISKIIDKFITDDQIIVKVRSITNTGTVCNMYDIMTSTNYFICNGILTHNCFTFDDPYICKRLEIVLGKSAFKRMSFPEASAPRYRTIERMGREILLVDFQGRCSLDYIDLFKKYEGGTRPSYKLESVAEIELPHLPKLSYEGTLEQLYHNDFNHFIRYNIRDTEILKGFEDKFGYVALANEMCHSATGQFSQVFGTVQLADFAIINYCHHKLNIIVPDRWETADGSIQGAYVLFPQRGMHDWLGSIDLSSLYPGAIRSINISPETHIGNFTGNIRDWEHIYQRHNDVELTVRFINDTTETKTVSEWVDYLIEHKYSVSGYGVIFSQEKQGVIPRLLADWYSQRKEYQKTMKGYKAQAQAAKQNNDMVQYELLSEQAEYYDRLQYCVKIRLNSLYGCLTNFNFRFFRLELGESTTGTGRMILRHQCRKVAEILDGEYHVDFPMYETIKEAEDAGVGADFALYGPKFNGVFPSKSVIYGDTDSTYFETGASTKEEAVKIADYVGKTVNASFPEFMRTAFFCTPGYDTIMATAREIVGSRGIFVYKKRYVIRVVDNEGMEVDKLKIMGLELKKTTLPKPIANKLSEFVKRLLEGEDWTQLSKDIVEYKSGIVNTKDILLMGLPKGVKGVEAYTQEYKLRGMKARLPGHVAASIHYNECLVKYDDKISPMITSDMKIKTYYLKRTFGKFKSIALPTDIDQIPEWFMEDFEPIIDREAQLERLINKPLEHILDAIQKEVPSEQLLLVHELLTF